MNKQRYANIEWIAGMIAMAFWKYKLWGRLIGEIAAEDIRARGGLN